MSNVIQFPNARPVARVSYCAGRPQREKSANQFNADDRSRIILQAIFGERM